MTDIIKVGAWRNKKYPHIVEFTCPMGCLHKRKPKIHQHCSSIDVSGLDVSNNLNVKGTVKATTFTGILNGRANEAMQLTGTTLSYADRYKRLELAILSAGAPAGAAIILKNTYHSGVTNLIISSGFGPGNNSFAATFNSNGDFQFNHDIYVGDVKLTSDRRIKSNIQDVPDNLALQQLRDIPCRYYEYIDKFTRGSDKTIGFIAQEVKEILPMAVTPKNEFIPDVYKLINYSWTTDNRDISNVKFIMSSSDLSDVSGITYKFYVSNKVDPSKLIDPSTNSIDFTREEMVESVGNHDNTFTFDNQYNIVFCYGKQVDDFHFLNKNKLFTLNFSATQEIDRIQQQHKTKIAKLETENTDLKSKIDELSSIIDKLKTASSFEDFKSKIKT